MFFFLLFKCIFPLCIFLIHFLASHHKDDDNDSLDTLSRFFLFKDWCCFLGSLLFVIWLLRQTSFTPSTCVRSLGSLNGERGAREWEGGSKLALALG